MAFIDSTVVNVALPAIQRTLGGTVIDMQWVVEGYGLLLGALILAGGAMGDVFGRRRMFLAGVAVFAIASAGCDIVAVGFLLFVVPSVGESYWTTFFPAFVVLGLGMAVSVAPLTTVVMSTVEQSRAGTASGINNAVARVAGLLAIAILGMVMVSSFSHYLNQRLPQLGLPMNVMHNLQTNEIRLAALEVPTEVDLNTAGSLASLVEHGFLFGFRLVMLICAGLAVVSSGFAWRMIGAKAER